MVLSKTPDILDFGDYRSVQTHDVIQIVDVYSLYYEDSKQRNRFDADGEAQSLSMLIRPLGRSNRKIVIVARDDYPRLLAYQRADYEAITMDTNRSQELRRFIRTMVSEIKQSPPKHLVVVSDEPEFVFLCEVVAPLTNLAVWAHSGTVPQELTDRSYGFRPLEELLPDLKIPRIDVRIDMENLVIGLLQLRWEPNMRDVVKAMRLALDDLGEVVSLTAYADWSQMKKLYSNKKIDYQREITLAGAESRYVISSAGKNTADMKIADDIRTIVERDYAAWGGAIDIIALVTMDRDFRPVVDTARIRGKRIVVLGLEHHLNHELMRAASEVRYLNSFFELGPRKKPQRNRPRARRPKTAALMIRAQGKGNASPSTRPLRVFLCHSSTDKAAVRTLYDRLSDDGLDPWLDEKKLLPGEDWDRAIRLAVEASDAVIVCLSKGSVTKSGYVQKEIKFALDEADKQPEGSVFVIPVKLEECDVPDRLSRLQWVTLFEEKGYEKLLIGLNDSIRKSRI